MNFLDVLVAAASSEKIVSIRGRKNPPESETQSLNRLHLQDRTTGLYYEIYIGGGKLSMVETTESEGAEMSITLQDRTTGKYYELYIDGGKLTMEEMEE